MRPRSGRSGLGSGGSGRRTNLALLVLLPVAVFTGLFANTIGTQWSVHPSVLHGVIGFAVLLLTPWKQAVIRRGLNKRPRTAIASILLLVFVTATLATGFMHVFGYQDRIGPLTLMQVHVGGGLGALLLAWLHYRAHPVTPRRSIDWNRRAMLRATTLTAGAAVLWLGYERALAALDLSGADRRFTGSHERGSFDPARMPVTSWLDDRVQRIEEAEWVLGVDSRTYRLADLVEGMPSDEFDAVLDCTSAWYSHQRWEGIRLDRLVDVGGHRSIVVRSQTGYTRRFPARDVERLCLATRIGGEPLSAGHGFPARIVAPGRRGFWWVKWVVEVRTSDVPWWLQLPFPPT